MWPWSQRSNQDFAEEIHAHVAHETRRLVEEEGLGFADAKAKALRSFGNVTVSQERFYEARRLLWLDDLRRDLSYGVRSLRKSPGFAAIAVLTLALGIGATTTIYSVVDTILLQPLPFASSDRLVRVVGRRSTEQGSDARRKQKGTAEMSANKLASWRELARSNQRRESWRDERVRKPHCER